MMERSADSPARRPDLRRDWPRGLFKVVAGALVVATALSTSFACRRKHRHIASVPPAPRATSSTAQPPAKRTSVRIGYTEEGIASWYGVPYHGRPAADGEVYNMETLVAAHRVLPFNTWLKVTNLSNGKTVTVRVIDRGPFIRGRVLDLSKAAARDIELLGPGLAKVRLEVVAAPVDIPSNDFYGVQVGAFSNEENAERLRVQYAQRFGTAQLVVKQGQPVLWRVLVGKEPSITAAQQLANVIAVEDKRIFVVRLDPASKSKPTSAPVADPGINLPSSANSPQPKQ